MPTNEQKELWQKEKAQMLKDKQNQPREVRRRGIDILFGGEKQSTNKKNGSLPKTPSENLSDDILRKTLGI